MRGGRHKGYVLYDYIYMTYCHKQIYRDKKISGHWDWLNEE